jgi:hypothetical protein
MKIYSSIGPPWHDPLNGDRAVPGPHLRPDPFLFCVMPGHVPEGTSLARPGWHSPLVGYSVCNQYESFIYLN